MSTIGIHPPEWLLAGSHPACHAVPEKIRYPSTNETLEIKDHQIVFQLAAKLNELNGGDPKLSVDFIPWIQNSDNAPYYYNGIRNADGTVPTVRTTNDLPGGDSRYRKANGAHGIKVAEAAKADNASSLPQSLQEAQQKIANVFQSPERLSAIANNMYRAHKQFIGKWGPRKYAKKKNC